MFIPDAMPPPDVELPLEVMLEVELLPHVVFIFGQAEHEFERRMLPK
jgi:hypothetical protein